MAKSNNVVGPIVETKCYAKLFRDSNGEEKYVGFADHPNELSDPFGGEKDLTLPQFENMLGEDAWRMVSKLRVNGATPTYLHIRVVVLEG